MKRLTAIVRREDAGTLTEQLLWLSCLEVEATTPEGTSDGAGDEPAAGSIRASAAAELSEAERAVSRLSAAIKTLAPYRSVKGGLFPKRNTVGRDRFSGHADENAKALADAETVSETASRLATLKSRLAANDAAAETLRPWLGWQHPLEKTATGRTAYAYGTLPAISAADAEAEIASGRAQLPSRAGGKRASQSEEAQTPGDPPAAPALAVEEVSSDERCTYAVAIWLDDDAEEARAALAALGWNSLDLRDTGGQGSAAERLARLADERRALEKDVEMARREMRSLADNLTVPLTVAHDVFTTDVERIKMKAGMAETARTVMLRGWVPSGASEAVSGMFDRLGSAGTPVAYELTDPAPEDKPPVLLLNKPAASPFESVVGLYSLPAYGTFDPTAVMSVFYFVIFGLMFGDVVYGLLLTVGGFLACRFLDLSPGIKKMIRMFAICGISSIVSGVLFGSYLGDLPGVFSQYMLGGGKLALAVWFDPVADPVKFLIVSLAVGAVHLLFGMGLNGYIRWRRGDRFGAIADTGSWYLLFAGIAFTALGLSWGIWVAVAGVAALVLTQGRAQKNPFMKLFKGVGSLYGLINYASDLLSYSRIMALGMASAVIASVINIMSTLMGPTVIGYILMPVILIFGHTVNIAVNLLGTFVHTSRLQYIEFFGKFYEDGGRAYSPSSPRPKYNRII